MSTTEARPVISDEEFDEDATVRLSDFNALKEMFHELKDKFESLKMEKTMEAMAQRSGDASDQMTSLQCFNSKYMIKPDQYDMEPGTFHNWNELFVSYMMSIDFKWGLILTTLQRKDAALKKEDISFIQDEIALYVNLLGFTKGKAKGRVISNSIELSFETYRQIYQKGKNATKMNIVLKKAEVLRPTKADTVNEIENRLNDWKEKRRYLEEVGEAPLKDDQKKTLLISILPVSVMEHLLKSAAMRSDVEGSYEELEKELLEYLATIDQQNRKAIGNLNSVADSADHNDQGEPIYEYTEPGWDDSYQGWLCAVSEANPQKKRKVQEETEEATSDDVSPSKGKSKGKGKGKEQGKGIGGLATIAVNMDTLHESVKLQKGKERARIGSRRNSGRQYNPGFIPKQWNYWRPGNVKGKGKGPEKSYGKGGVSVIGQEGLFNFPQLGCVNPTQWQHDCWSANEVDNNGEGNWPGRLAQLCKTKKIEKIEPASQFAETAEQFQPVKKGKKVSWKRLDCQDELHRSMTYNKFATLTSGEEEQECDEDLTSIGGNCSFALNTAV